MARGELTDDEWFLIEPHLPLGERGPIPDLRQQFDAVMWRFRTGSPWRDLPAEYGPWSTVYDRFRSWAKIRLPIGRPISHDVDLDKQRNTVERCINRIKEWRGLAFRFDKTPGSYLAGLHLRGAILWIRSL